jgi:hypothetical protein
MKIMNTAQVPANEAMKIFQEIKVTHSLNTRDNQAIGGLHVP